MTALFVLALALPLSATAETIVSGDIRTDTTWTKAGSPYIVAGSIYFGTVEPGKTATLTIEPGVVVRFFPGTVLEIGSCYDDPGRDGFGRLVAMGTAAEPILFTSNSPTPAPGDWGGIIFNSCPIQITESILEHCTVEYGNSANLFVRSGSITISNSTIRHSRQVGVNITHIAASALIGGTDSGNLVSENGAEGIICESPVALIANNTFSGNGSFPLKIAPSVEVRGNSYTGNARQAIAMTDGAIERNTIWRKEAVPYVLEGDVIEVGSNSAQAPATLVIAPGVEVRFAQSGWAISVGKYRGPANNGALVAQGTASAPIRFTSDLPNPQPESWGAIIFQRECDSARSVLEHGVVEYSTYGIVLSNSSPTLRFNTIRRNWSGIDGWFDSAATVIRCNRFEENYYGIWIEYADVNQTIASNNFIGNTEAGINFDGDPGRVDASGNWWGDQAGPNAAGDKVIGHVDFAPWLTEPSVYPDEPPMGLPPFRPGRPYPAAGAVNVPLTQEAEVRKIRLAWSGGDPNFGDSAVYDVYFGTAPESLTKIAGNLAAESLERIGLAEEKTYYWQVVSRDQAGAETAGPVWSFTTLGQLPDLVVTNPTWWCPLGDIGIGKGVIFSATITNIGNGKVYEPFIVNFLIDGVSIGQQLMNYGLPFPPGEPRTIGALWIATIGTHTLKVVADSGQAVLESSETNNTVTLDLPPVSDTMAPQLQSTSPQNGAQIRSVSQIAFTLEDLHGTLDYEAIKASVAVTGSSGSIIPGTTTAANDTFTFTTSTPLPDDTYQVTFTAKDTAGNSAEYNFAFTVDNVPPAPPQVDPVPSTTANPYLLLKGTKEDHSAILLNGSIKVGLGTGESWQFTTTLASGPNTLVVTARDRAGNVSAPVTVEVVLDDSRPPVVATLSVNGEGDGTSAALNWTGYDEAAYGAVANYRIYYSESAFTSVAGMTPRATVNAGQFTYVLRNLARGKTYWFAVVAVGLNGNADNQVNAVAATLKDVKPPANVTGIVVQSHSDRLVFTWNAAPDHDGDLDGYRVFFGTDTEGEPLPKDTLNYERTGLSPATGYFFKIVSVDKDGNRSAGLTRNAATLLPNPSGLKAEPFSGYVNLSWEHTEPSNLRNGYRVYVSASDFTSIAGMTPVVSPKTAYAKVAGLANGTTYYFAVTTLNISGGETPEVATVSATPMADTEGPVISDVSVNEVPLVSGHTMRAPATFTCHAQDPAGVARVEFLIDGAVIATDTSPVYSFYWDILSAADGGHTLTIAAYDTLGNRSTRDFALVVALEVPPAPVITQPPAGLLTNKAAQAVAGYSAPLTTVDVFLDGVKAAGPLAVDSAGKFNAALTLKEGPNLIGAAARNRAGVSPMSEEVLVTLDSTLPDAPVGLAAAGKPGGAIQLSWKAPTDKTVAGYNIYRSETSFGALALAARVNANPVTATGFSDLPPTDGTWFYRVTALDPAANESDPSNEAKAVSDRTAPRAAAIAYAPQGPFDPATGAMAPGTVQLTLTVSEPLQAAPYLSIVPEGGVPIGVELIQETETRFKGFFVIAPETPSGTAFAIFSGRDLIGNRGTEIDAGATLLVDTAGPAVSRLEITPADPIKNDEKAPVAVTVNLGLTEKPAPGTLPTLAYTLSGPGREPIAIEPLTELAPAAGDAATYQAEFTLPADTGLGAPESLAFAFSAVDKLQNKGERIQVKNLFQVYQGNLPPLAAPEGLAALSLPGGKIRLSWKPVAHAAGYELFRKAPGEAELTAYQRPGTATEVVDQPGADGIYTYAVASIRLENGQEAVSGLSAAVTAAADSVPPEAPLAFSLVLAANGIAAAWQPPPATEPVTYSLYRADAQEITTVEGLAPLAAGIAQTSAVDPTPSPSAHCYAVTAVDAAGNESLPSNSVYLNFQLLPVSGITVTQSGTDPPALAWSHPGGDIAGYDVTLGGKAGGVKLNPQLLSGKSFIDTGYAGDERTYTLIAVDEEGVESLPRSITLPKIETQLKAESRLARGVMNRLEVTLENQGAAPVEELRLKLSVAGREHLSEPVALPAGAARVVPVVVGGYAELSDENEVSTAIEIKPAANDIVRIERTVSIPAEDGALVLQIQPEGFTRAATGLARFTLENTGAAEIEIVTATGSGGADSPEIAFTLLDADGNVLAVKPFRQVIGESLVVLPNGNTVARIPAGKIFTSEPAVIPVPAAAPDNCTLRLEIGKIHYRQGKPEAVEMAGLATTQAVTLAETGYYGEVTAITPKTSTGEAEIVISGRAVERAGGKPLANVPLKLVIALSGFERTFTVTTGTDGGFTHRFTPPAGESGVYAVRAVHPDVTDKPVQGTFTVSRISVTPDTINLNIPKNYEKTIALQATPGEGTAVRNLRIVYAESDQVGGAFSPGVHLTPGEPAAVVSERETVGLPFTVWADNTAAAAVTLRLRVVSDESPPAGWAVVAINAAFSEARPVITFTPDHIETGVTLNGQASETVTIKNSGLAELNGLALSLTDAAGGPAPAWVSLSGTLAQPVLNVGESLEVRVDFAPGAAVAEGDYQFKLKITAANHPPVDVNLFCAVTQQGFGNVLLKAADIYTGTLGKDGKLIQGLAGARVELQNELVLSEVFTLETDEVGEAYFLALAAGQYKCRVSAANHQEYIGRLRVKPGISVTQEVFLDYNLVTVEWRVTEIVIQDKYQIVLIAVYETNVPAAVVVAEPASLSLPAMQPGDVMNGEFTLTNYGLIRADNLKLTLPQNDPYYRYETLGTLPSSLAAKGRITVPYRVTCIKSPEGDGAGTGGGCSSYGACALVDYGYRCANGADTRGTARHCWTYTYGSCGGSPPAITPGGGNWSVGGGGGGGTSSPAAPAPKPITGVKCFPSPVRKEAYCGDDCALSKESRQGILQDVASQVNLVLGEYTRAQTDLAAKVPGGGVGAERRYYGNAWHFEHTRHNLVVKPAVIGTGIESVEKAGVTYTASALDSDLFLHDTYRIRKTATGFRWEEKSGGFKEFDAEGRMLAYGGRNGVIGRLSYSGGKLAAVSDRNNLPVLFYEWDGERVLAVRDRDNRRVDYAWSEGRLSAVTDPTGAVTQFSYDGQGRIAKVTDAEGREVQIGYDDYGRVASVVNALNQGHFFEYDYDEGRQELYARMRTSAGLVKEIWFDKADEIRRVDVNGRSVMKIAKDGRHLIITDERGEITRKEYDERDNLTRVLHPDGAIESFTYEPRFNRRTREVNALGVATAYEYDALGNLVRKTEAAGTADARVTEYGYDETGNLVFTRRLADATAPEAVTTMSYDASGNLKTITDPEGGITRFTEHDLAGNVLKKTDPRGKLWEYGYDAAGRLVSATDPLGNAAALAYDRTGRKIGETDPEGRERRFVYDAAGRLAKTIDAAGAETLFEYNADGKLTRKLDTEGRETRYELDLDGRLFRTTDGNGNAVTVEYAQGGTGCSSCASGAAGDQPARILYPTFSREFTYDKRGRKTRESEVISETERLESRFSYDAAGNLVSRTDREGQIAGYTYDPFNRLSWVTDAMSKETAYAYDSRNNLLSLTDAEGQTTGFAYDRNNRLTRETRPMGQALDYTYDPAGNLLSKIDAKGQKTTYEYDPAGRLTRVTLPQAATAAPRRRYRSATTRPGTSSPTATAPPREPIPTMRQTASSPRRLITAPSASAMPTAIIKTA